MAVELVPFMQTRFPPFFRNAMKHFVAKLVKSFGRLSDATESLDDFRYAIAWFLQRKMLHSVPFFEDHKR